MSLDPAATETLARYADAVTAHDWEGVAALLAPGFTARLLHTGETYDGPGFVALSRDYPGPWRFVAEETVGAGASAVLRARVESGPATYHVASFGTVDDHGLLRELTEVWTSPEVRHHALDYVEIGAPDLLAAKEFYRAGFGWTFQDYGPDYAGIRAPSGRGEVGGLNPGRPAGPGGPLVLLFSDDLDATVEAVRAAGGTVTEGPYDFPGGRRFHFTDPGGTELGVWAQA